MRAVFIESNPFASRLHVLSPLVKGAARAGLDPYVLYPAREVDNHWRAWTQEVGGIAHLQPVHIRRAPKVSGHRRAGLRTLLAHAEELLEPGDKLLITALDDVMRDIPRALPLIAAIRRRGIRILLFKYRVQDLFEPRPTMKARGIRAVTRAVMVAGGTDLVIFDERYADQYVKVVPDPWEGTFGQHNSQSARRELQIGDGPAVIGLIGKQDKRKGFDTAVQAIINLVELGCPVRCLILGKVAPEFKRELDRIEMYLGDDLIHETEFVTDLMLPKYFAACDQIWLPYDATFTSTSGVLARAAASGVPVVASDHGLVGYRVAAHQLGRTFPTGDPDALALESRRLITECGSYSSERAASWAQSCSSEALVGRVAKILTEK